MGGVVTRDCVCRHIQQGAVSDLVHEHDRICDMEHKAHVELVKHGGARSVLFVFEDGFVEHMAVGGQDGDE